MSEIHVTLPDHLDEFVRKEAERQGFTAPGEYILAVIPAERKRKMREWLEAADALARELGVSRSELYAHAVEEYVAKHRQEDVTARLNEVYAFEPSGLKEPFRKAQALSVRDSEW